MMRLFKKSLKISTSALEKLVAKMPTCSELKVVKLTYEQAMNFKEYDVSFEELVACYGASNRLKPNEHYEGYIAVSYPWGEVGVMHLVGAIQKIDPNEAKYCSNKHEAKVVREGKRWRVIGKNSDGSSCPGKLHYVWTLNGCLFSNTIAELQKEKYLPSGMDAEETDRILKDKLVAALCDNKIVEVSYAEDFILRRYFGENLSYKNIFSSVS